MRKTSLQKKRDMGELEVENWGIQEASWLPLAIERMMLVCVVGYKRLEKGSGGVTFSGCLCQKALD